MTSDQAYLAHVEAAQPDELRRLLSTATADEQRLLRVYLGDERYRRMRALALRQRATRSRSQRRGNVVVLHGIMGAELSRSQGHVPGGGGSIRQIWVKLMRLAFGDLRYLALDRAGTGPADPRYEVEATGIMKKHYGEQLLTLAERWEVRAFWYDWRRDLHEAARRLHLKLIEWFDDAPVHLVAHSMGGLVSRTFIADYPDHWKAMWDAEHDGRRGGRLVMLGTPNHGSYAVPQILTGTESLIRKLELVDLRHNLDELLAVVNTFVGSYQMMPALHTAGDDEARRVMERLYKAGMYARDSVSQDHLDAARAFHDALRPVVDPERMVYVAGYNQPTYTGINDWAGFRDRNAKTARRAYDVTLDGDGRVPHTLGLLETEEGKKVPTYYVEEEHGALPENDDVLRALDDLLTTGETTHLLRAMPKKRSVSKAAVRDRMERAEQEHDDDEQRIRAHLSRRQRSVRSSDPDVLADHVTADDRVAEEMLLRGFLSAGSTTTTEAPDMDVPFAPPELTVRVLCDDIGGAGYLGGEPPVDAISVGHYRGVRPTNAELALDRAISAARGRGKAATGDEESRLLITSLTERGTIRGDHAQPFFLPDYRTPRKGEAPDRTVAIAGMGDPGRFGVPELTVLARELVWALGSMGKRHLASVLIGAGAGNLRIDEAVPAWIRGFKHALTGAAANARVEHFTIVEYSPALAIEIDRALRAVGEELDPHRMVLHYEPFTTEQVRALQKQEAERRKARLQREIERLDTAPGAGAPESAPLDPTRLTVMLEGDTYRYGAITESASVPERVVRIDPRLVDQANDQLAVEWDPTRQRDHGRVLERLLIPQDLRPHLTSTAPLVLLLDATTARIHWEMVAQPDVSSAADRSTERAPAATPAASADDAFFLGISRGFTRQLRTQFASPPEPPPPPSRVLRVLVVADPAEDAPLPGAEEEGMEVADLFEHFNTLQEEDRGENRVEVKRLFGPQEATRLNVLSELTLRSYDALHFAGHCVYDPENPDASGWIFSNGERLSARELNRIDRIPGFVFSNACESGITPDRERTASLAPSFAEAFFERGVTNFVCTAWPIDDLSARTFARVLYGHLLGISVAETEGGLRYTRALSQEAPLMYAAMRAARRAIADTPNGFQTWGAYQHYGNPYYRFFDLKALEKRRAAQSGGAGGKGKKAASTASSAGATRAKRKTTRKTTKKRTTDES
ncbi:MAG: alpha/beta fold hydrolase [Rhodothermales bacterium]